VPAPTVAAAADSAASQAGNAAGTAAGAVAGAAVAAAAAASDAAKSAASAMQGESTAGTATGPTQSAALNAERVKLYFDVGSAIPPTDAIEQLGPLVGRARSSSDLKLAVAGYHDRSGTPAPNADLARKRAQAVRSVLVAAGVQDGRILLSEPAEALGSDDDREARRVEVGVAP